MLKRIINYFAFESVGKLTEIDVLNIAKASAYQF